MIIPTYNEIESLPRQVAGVRLAVPDAHILVVDDGSPDGTGEWAETFAHSDEHVHILHRQAKQGLGVAYRSGFAWALERQYEVIVEMDADGSHRAQDLPLLLAEAGDHDLVIGSRWVRGGQVENWPFHRKFLSTNANRYVRLALGIKVKDATAGFRAYRAATLRQLDLAAVESQGYCFQVDMTWRTLLAGGSVAEVPITFVERDLGASKMSGAIIREALTKVTEWGIQRVWHKVFRAGR
ncbi:polyprenol monophosphomannose synthase [Demequina lutea]|uniref:Dolichol-phosphate mannosyltransferase n=1 Tax=Demequina lutea TaxID=431489 RepID=A0A7Z0CK65_9MICO|nr:polyprenol monophosphomannose synthase [Demequina lutea]NYI41400.1 dolichol-phosphate mannosyltransferase [Demequina lutea]